MSDEMLKLIADWQAANPCPGKAGEWMIWRHEGGMLEWVKKPRGTDSATGMGFPELIGLDPDASALTAAEAFTAGMPPDAVATASRQGKEARLQRGLAVARQNKAASQRAAAVNRKVDDAELASLWAESGEIGNERHGRLKWVSAALAERGIDITPKRISDRLEATGIRSKQ